MAASSSLAAQNKAALDYFIQTPVTTQMITYLACKASSVIRCDYSSQASAGAIPTPPATPPARPTSLSAEPGLPPLEAFITSIVQQSHVQVPTLMPALVYLARLREKLPSLAQGIPSTVHRIFLAALILAAKNLNDSSPKNKHWARYTSVPGYPDFCFTNSEVNLMEKQLLYLLDWDLRVTNDDLYFHLDPFLAPIRVKQQQHADRRLQAMLRERERTAQLQHAQAQYELRQQQRRHAHSVSMLAAAHLDALPHIVSQARLEPRPQMYDSPGYSRPTSYYPHSRDSSRAPTRTPSLSPPTRCDSTASYASSASASPASFVANPPSQQRPDTFAYQLPILPLTKPQDAKIQIVDNQGIDDARFQRLSRFQGYATQLPQAAHLPTPQVVSALDKTLPTVPTRPRDDEITGAKPAKKLKTSAGSLFSRFLGGGGGNGGLGNTAPAPAALASAC